MARKPREGSLAWEKTLPHSPTYVLNSVQMLAERAERGDQAAVESLTRWLELHPDMRALVRGLDDLVTRTERAWVDRLCGTDELARKAISDDLAGLKAELLGPNPSPLDKVLAATVVVAHAAYAQAALLAARPADGPAVRAAREKLLTVAQARLQDAVKGWQLIAGKTAKGVRPAGIIKLFEPGQATA